MRWARKAQDFNVNTSFPILINPIFNFISLSAIFEPGRQKFAQRFDVDRMDGNPCYTGYTYVYLQLIPL